STITQAVTRLRAPFRRNTSPLSWVSRPAWVTLFLAVAAWIVGHILGWLELVVLGAGFLAILIASSFFAIGRPPYEFCLRLRAGRVGVGERAMGGMDVRNAGTSHSLHARMALPVGPVTARFARPAQPRCRDHDEPFTVPTDRRRALVVRPLRTLRGPPFGLMRRAVDCPDPEALYVHPRTLRPGSESAGFLPDLAGRASKDI